MRVAIWMMLAVPVLASCRDVRVEAPEPTRNFSFDADSLPQLPPMPTGTIVAPLALDLDAAIAALEQEVPKRFGNIEQRLRYAARNGLSGREAYTIQQQIQRLEYRVQREARDWNNRDNRNWSDRDRDGRNDRYEDDRGYSRD